MGNVKIRNYSVLSLIVGDTLFNPGDVKQVREEDLTEFKSGPAGRWYYDNCLEIIKDSAPVEVEPVEVEPVEAEPVEVEPVEAEPVEAEPVEVEPVEAEPVEVEKPRKKGKGRR